MCSATKQSTPDATPASRDTISNEDDGATDLLHHLSTVLGVRDHETLWRLNNLSNGQQLWRKNRSAATRKCGRFLWTTRGFFSDGDDAQFFIDDSNFTHDLIYQQPRSLRTSEGQKKQAQAPPVPLTLNVRTAKLSCLASRSSTELATATQLSLTSHSHRQVLIQ